MQQVNAPSATEIPKNLYAYNFPIWKKSIVRSFLPESRVEFVSNSSHIPPNSTLTIWGRKAIPEQLPPGINVLRLEDGFLRSVGLGADLVKPLSWVVDSRGIYFDSTQPSDLEVLLQTLPFTPDLLARARRLKQLVVGYGITKYNVGISCWQRPPIKKKVILVPGQVEGDASLRYGAPGIRSNISLLQTVRRNNPDAYLVYKPHPDVQAGLKAVGMDEHRASSFYDEIIGDVPMDALLSAVDEVQVLTSLTGFEALLRGKPVTCHGQPFYAGWGLTHDMIPIPRRTRHLSIDELVACALILYPRYISPTSGKIISPEQAVFELQAMRKLAAPWWRHGLRWILKRVVA